MKVDRPLAADKWDIQRNVSGRWLCVAAHKCVAGGAALANDRLTHHGGQVVTAAALRHGRRAADHGSLEQLGALLLSRRATRQRCQQDGAQHEHGDKRIDVFHGHIPLASDAKNPICRRPQHSRDRRRNRRRRLQRE